MAAVGSGDALRRLLEEGLHVGEAEDGRQAGARHQGAAARQLPVGDAGHLEALDGRRRHGAVQAEEGHRVALAGRPDPQAAGLLLGERIRQRLARGPEGDRLVAVAGEAGLHEELDVAVDVRAGHVEAGRPAPGDVAQAGLDEAIADVARVAEADGVELHDRPLVAMAVALDADETAQVAVLLVDVEAVVRPECPEREPEEREDADGRAGEREPERAGARVRRLGQARELAEGGQVREPRRPDPARATHLPGTPGHASTLVRRRGWGRRPAPSPGSACSAAIVATRRWKRVSPASSGWKAVAMTFPCADGHDPAVVEAGEDVHPGTDVLDDRGPDEDRMDRPLAEDGHVEIGLERVELAAEGVPLHHDVQERQDRLLVADDRATEDDHPGAGPEDRRSRAGEVKDRLGEAPALDQPAHRRALAARQDQPLDLAQVARQAHLDPLDADGGERRHVLAKGALQRQHADPHRGAPARPARRLVATSPAPRGVRPRGSPRARCRASARRGPWTPRPGSSGCRSGWSPGRSRSRSVPGPRS